MTPVILEELKHHQYDDDYGRNRDCSGAGAVESKGCVVNERIPRLLTLLLFVCCSH